MVKFNKKNFLELIIKRQKKINSRQKAPDVFDLTTVGYVFSSNFILKNKDIFNGQLCHVKIPQERSIDIDNNYDLIVARSLIKK